MATIGLILHGADADAAAAALDIGRTFASAGHRIVAIEDQPPAMRRSNPDPRTVSPKA